MALRRATLAATAMVSLDGEATMRLAIGRMSGSEGGWHAHPDGVDADSDPSPVEPKRVVGLGAICDLREQRSDHPRSVSFSVAEFVTLDDGQRVILHDDRGFTIGSGSPGDTGSGNNWGGETVESITRDVLNVVLPDDDDCEEDHPWLWLVDLARARGLVMTAEDLRSLPYEVVLSDNVARWLTSFQAKPK